MCEVDEIEELKRQRASLFAALNEKENAPETQLVLRRQLAMTELSIANLERSLNAKETRQNYFSGFRTNR